MILNCCSLGLLLCLLIQSNSASLTQNDVLTPAEREQLQGETKIDRRIKIYEAASVRLHKALGEAVAKGDFQSVPETLKSWTSLLAISLKDIEASAGQKKRPKSLIRYEIQVRKAISDMQDYKVRAPIEQQDTFDSCLSQAEAIRKQFVEILFLR
jgi:hypothetical protein